MGNTLGITSLTLYIVPSLQTLDTILYTPRTLLLTLSTTSQRRDKMQAYYQVYYAQLQPYE